MGCVIGHRALLSPPCPTPVRTFRRLALRVLRYCAPRTADPGSLAMSLV